MLVMTTAGDSVTATAWRPAGAGSGDDDDVVDGVGIDPHARDLGAVQHERRIRRPVPPCVMVAPAPTVAAMFLFSSVTPTARPIPMLQPRKAPLPATATIGGVCAGLEQQVPAGLHRGASTDRGAAGRSSAAWMST